MKDKNAPVPETVHDFLAFISSEKACSLATQQAYEADLCDFAVFCRLRGIDILSVDLSHLRQYLAKLRRDELSPRSIARKSSTLRQFYCFCLREGRIDKDPSELLTVSRKGRKLPKHLTIREMFRLVAAANGSNHQSVRDRAMLELWYATGARVSELAQLRARDFDWEKGMVKFVGKGRRERFVPVHREAMRWCERYREIRHRQMAAQGRLEASAFFLSSRGKAFSRQGIWKLVKRYAKAAGIPKNVWPHMIRHSFATHVLRGGADLRVVQEMLGHQSIATTEIYTHLDIESLRAMQAKFHPRG